MSKINIVIVGGGGYGAQIARALSSKLDSSKYQLTLIESRDYYLHLVGTLRALVSSEGSLEKRVLIPYDKLFQNGHGTLKKGTVTAIKKNPDGTSGFVVLSSGEEVPWNVLLLSPGNTWEGGLPLPATREEAAQVIEDWRRKIKDADRIALVGGGAVGIELAGEIRDVYPNKKISIIHGSSHLLNDAYPDKFRIDMEKRARSRDIDLLLGNKVEQTSSDVPVRLTTSNGTTLDVDLLIPTRGGKPNTAFVTSLGPDVLTPTGHIKVTPTQQLVSESNIMAIGDAADAKEQHQVGKLTAYSALIVANVIALADGQSPPKKYSGTVEAIAIPVGKKHGGMYVGILWGLCFGNWVVSMLKGKDLFTTPTWKALGHAG